MDLASMLVLRTGTEPRPAAVGWALCELPTSDARTAALAVTARDAGCEVGLLVQIAERFAHLPRVAAALLVNPQLPDRQAAALLDRLCPASASELITTASAPEDRRLAAVRWAALRPQLGAELPVRHVERWVATFGCDPLFTGDREASSAAWRVPLYSWLAAAAADRPGATSAERAFGFVEVAVGAFEAGARTCPGWKSGLVALVTFADRCAPSVPFWARRRALGAFEALAALGGPVGIGLELPSWAAEASEPVVPAHLYKVEDVTRVAMAPDGLLAYLHRRLGDDPARWTLALTLADTWTATVEELADTVLASQQLGDGEPAAAAGER